MAVARYLTDPQPQQVNINSQGASPAGVQIDGTQPVQFNNNSSSPISITFANTAISNQRVFNDIANIPAGQSSTESPQVSPITVNYTINTGGNIVGPFAIEVGTGPMQISVTNAVPNPSLAVIPPNGEVLFTATDANCAISWKDNHDPFSPLLTEVYVGQANNQPGTEQGSSAKNFPYSLNTSAPSPRGHHVGGGGGGTIKVT